MDRAFFRSREFLVAGIIALLLVAGWATAVTVALVGGPLQRSTSCDTASVSGTPVALTPEESLRQGTAGRYTRETTYTIPAADLASATASLCVEVGEVTLRSSSTGDARLIITVEADGLHAERAARELPVDTRAATSGGALRLAAHQAAAPRHLWALWGLQPEIDVRITLEVPPTLPLNLTVATAVGDVSLSGATLASMDVRTDVGDVTGEALTLSGPASVASDVGDVTLGFRNATSGSVRVVSDVGDVALTLPRSENHGYDVTATADVGEVTLDLGPTERNDSRGDPPGERAAARTVGYETALVKISISITTDVGDIQVITR